MPYRKNSTLPLAPWMGDTHTSSGNNPLAAKSSIAATSVSRRTAGSVTMVRFSGMEIKPYSQLTELPRVRIDRVRVEVQRTLFGEVEYHLVGTMGDEGKAWPICAPLTELPDVWERKKEIESAICMARQEEQYARKRKDAGYLETPARPV